MLEYLVTCEVLVTSKNTCVLHTYTYSYSRVRRSWSCWHFLCSWRYPESAVPWANVIPPYRLLFAQWSIWSWSCTPLAPPWRFSASTAASCTGHPWACNFYPWLAAIFGSRFCERTGFFAPIPSRPVRPHILIRALRGRQFRSKVLRSFGCNIALFRARLSPDLPKLDLNSIWNSIAPSRCTRSKADLWGAWGRLNPAYPRAYLTATDGAVTWPKKIYRCTD